MIYPVILCVFCVKDFYAAARLLACLNYKYLTVPKRDSMQEPVRLQTFTLVG